LSSPMLRKFATNSRQGDSIPAASDGDVRELSFDVCIEFAEFAVLLATKHSRVGTLSVE